MKACLCQDNITEVGYSVEASFFSTNDAEDISVKYLGCTDGVSRLVRSSDVNFFTLNRGQDGASL